MDIDKLYKSAKSGGKKEENELFSNISEIFQLFVRHRVGDDNDCQEIVQETLMNIADKYRQIDYTVSFSAWAYSVLKNKIADYYRKKKIVESRFVQADDFDNHSGKRQIDLLLERQIQQCLKYVQKQNPKYLRILNLRYLGFDIDEISGKLNMAPNYIYVCLFRAREMLKKCLQGANKLDE